MQSAIKEMKDNDKESCRQGCQRSRCEGVISLQSRPVLKKLGKKIPGIGNCLFKGLWQEGA